MTLEVSNRAALVHWRRKPRRRYAMVAAAATLLATFASVSTAHADDVVGFSAGAVADTQSMVMTDSVPCPPNVAGGVCAAVITVLVEPDVTVPPLPPQCGWWMGVYTCSPPNNAKYYKITIGFNQSHCYGTGYSYGCYPEYTVQMNSEDWYNGGGSGNVWISASCTVQHDYACGSDSHSSFWDSGRGASTDWDNRSMISNAGCCVNDQTVYLRTYVTPSGGVSFYAGL